jgi:hypothetical protein
MPRSRRWTVLSPLLLVVALVGAACGGGGSSSGADAGVSGPAHDKDIADAAAFHLHDFPNGWQEIDFEALGAPPTMDTLGACLGPSTASDETAKVVRGFHFGPGINEVAVSEVRVLRDAAGAQAEIAPTVKPEFAACVAEKIKGLLSTSIGEGLSVGDVTGTADALSAGGANGVGVDMLARIDSATGQRTIYPSAAFLQKGRAVAIITLLSNNSSVSDNRRTLSAAVAGRLPVE